ncbi:hypothetical protein CHL67_09595 [Prosthecochloris sp. GSB1]|uniref:hypothetical protein n=1 Tax=Prosthecochloris sp. GSB1 TaxID=281093 RepID=UPI000B8C783C|nr:hypothetical protein [Prosthecochloris sp. GSB1]ASQ91136.1 hypothetical protein CHL67_09595 [Prosthecochloris sp. GSB1]
MEKKAEHFKSIDARIEELEKSIRDRETELKNRAGHLTEEIRSELAPGELVRKYPLQAAGAALLTGFLGGKIIRSIVTHSPERKADDGNRAAPEPSGARQALGALGIDILHSGKNLAFSYLQHYLDQKIKAKRS